MMRSWIRRSIVVSSAVFAFHAMASAQVPAIYLVNETEGMPNSGKVYGWEINSSPPPTIVEHLYDYMVSDDLFGHLLVEPAAVADFNDDGTMDAVWVDRSSPFSHDVVIVLHDEFGASLAYALDKSLFRRHSVLGAGDFNGDRVPDLLIRTGSTLTVWILEDFGSSVVSEIIELGSDIIADTERFAGFVDVSGDGLADVILNATDRDLAYWESTGSDVVKNPDDSNTLFPLLTLKKTKRLRGIGNIHVIGTMDMDGDTFADLVVRENKADGKFSVWFFLNDGTGDYPALLQMHFRNASYKRPIGIGLVDIP